MTCGTCKLRGWDKARNCAGEPGTRVVFRSGEGPDGAARVESTECPVRLRDHETDAVVNWFLRSAQYTGGLWGVSPVPTARVEWPRPGGLARQNPRLVEAFHLLRFEMEYLPRRESRKRERSRE